MKRVLLFLLVCLVQSVGLVMGQEVTMVKGTVTSADDGEPVIGASVLVKGTQIGTITDAEGQF